MDKIKFHANADAFKSIGNNNFFLVLGSNLA
jgi:hypothetical protein